MHPGNHKTYLQRQLKRKAMTTFFDVRGVRRLSLLCDFVAKVEVAMMLMVIMLMIMTTF